MRSGTRSPATCPSAQPPTSSRRSSCSAPSGSARSRRRSRTSFGRSAGSRSRGRSWYGEVAMTNSSSEAALPTPELRTGSWTRLGSSSVLGDAVTEHTLSGLAEQAQAAARAQGYATGWAQGRRAAEARAEEESRQVAAERLLEDQRRADEHRA